MPYLGLSTIGQALWNKQWSGAMPETVHIMSEMLAHFHTVDSTPDKWSTRPGIPAASCAAQHVLAASMLTLLSVSCPEPDWQSPRGSPIG